MSLPTWSLEVVKGRETGRLFAFEGAETVLGNALGGAKGIDLGPQEGDSPRKMAARQAVVESQGKAIAVRDLDSPGGTFVNRQRLLPGQSRPLAPGDLIQLGGVQLRVVEAGAKTSPLKPVEAFSFKLADGTVCQTWDDFLRVASQKWTALRDELTSGRIDGWLRAIGRVDLVTTAHASASADERLDAWLGKIPSTVPAKPELDVHPKRLVVRVTPGGGLTARSVQVSNLGYRLLRVDARIEPTGATWVKLGEAVAGRSQVVIDSFDLPLEIAIPETLPSPLRAALVIGGNGGDQRIDLVLEAKSATDPAPDASVAPPVAQLHLREAIGRFSTPQRFIVLAFGGFLLRMIVGLASGMLGDDGMKAADAESPALTGVAIVLAVVAGVAAGVVARRNGVTTTVFASASGGLAGAGLAAVVVSTCRSIEPMLGRFSGSPIAVSLLWAAIGAGLAAASLLFAPTRSKPEKPI